MSAVQPLMPRPRCPSHRRCPLLPSLCKHRFEHRHNSLTPTDVEAMSKACGFANLDDLITATVREPDPAGAARRRQLPVSTPYSNRL